MTSKLPQIIAMALAISNILAFEFTIIAHDFVIPPTSITPPLSPKTRVIEDVTHVVTPSYVSPTIRALDATARSASIVVFNDIGVNSGVDHLYAIQAIDEAHGRKAK